MILAGLRFHHVDIFVKIFFFYGVSYLLKRNEPHRDKTNEMVCAPSEDSDQPGHLPNLIRVFAVRLMGS